jgi:hypothetical protein
VGRRARRYQQEKFQPAKERRAMALSTYLESVARNRDICVCRRDALVYAPGGSRTLPLEQFGNDLSGAQVDALVAGLRGT